MDQYCILGRIGEGAHGIVFKAKHVEVVQLKAVFPHGAGFVLAFEFMLSDLAEVVRHAQRPLAQAQVKSYLQMLLKGVAFCHANNIVHQVLWGIWRDSSFLWHSQDLKPANLLISASGQLKIADFGLARVFSPDGSRLYTHQVATRTVGCIMGELLNGSPLFPGENNIEQLCCVLHILGTPSPQVWPELAKLPDYNKISFKEQAPVPLEEVLPDASPQALDLLSQFLLYPPLRRITASRVRLSSISTSSQLLCLPIHLSYRFLSVQGDLPPRPIQAPTTFMTSTWTGLLRSRC
ncbi:cyclin-dependent kinase 20 isoform X2 [Callithrix jacchus]|uniref:cyclin-dependent kinase 20 isoform X2 n=1 Tax=Callithrix jacchus TaxID=9483 RepID=UPI00159D3B02|nr:cyclin-dependent kinase 20 isoform X2 [Callithrix jacchus]